MNVLKNDTIKTMKALQRWEKFSEWAKSIQNTNEKMHKNAQVCCKPDQVPNLSVSKDKFSIQCKVCRLFRKETIREPKELFRWFVIPSAWCKEWNFYLEALVTLDTHTRQTDQEISLRTLEEIVYEQLKPQYDLQRKKELEKD